MFDTKPNSEFKKYCKGFKMRLIMTRRAICGLTLGLGDDGHHRGDADVPAAGRGSHSSTLLLNVSTFCGIRRVHDFPPVY